MDLYLLYIGTTINIERSFISLLYTNTYIMYTNLKLPRFTFNISATPFFIRPGIGGYAGGF